MLSRRNGQLSNGEWRDTKGASGHFGMANRARRRSCRAHRRLSDPSGLMSAVEEHARTTSTADLLDLR